MTQLWACKQVKPLFWVHIQAQSSALQTLTSIFPGHWAFTIHLSITRNLAPRLTNQPSKVPIYSWVERSHAVWSALLWGTTSRPTGRVLNSGLDKQRNPESYTLLLDQLACRYNIENDNQFVMNSVRVMDAFFQWLFICIPNFQHTQHVT